MLCFMHGDVEQNDFFRVLQVCNHKSECQCEPGWAPPSCSSVDGVFSSSLSTGKNSPQLFTNTHGIKNYLCY